MGILSRLFGAKEPPQTVQLAKGRGFTTRVVGESHCQAALEAVAGGKTEHGVRLLVTAQIVFDSGNQYDPNAVGILLDGRLVGYIPKEESAQFRHEVLAVNPQELPVACHAKIVGGWRYVDDDDGEDSEGHFGIKLNVARPLRLDTS